MLTTYRHGALHVVAHVSTPTAIRDSLRALDERLFVERQVTLSGEHVWCVCVDVGGDRPPVTLLEWRDPRTGKPINELSSGLVDRVRALERDGDRLAASVVHANQKRVEEARRRAQEDYAEMGRDMQPRASGLRSAVLPRGQYLRMSRDQRRARGEKV